MTFLSLAGRAIGSAAALGLLAACSGGASTPAVSTPGQQSAARPATGPKWWQYYYKPSGYSLSRVQATYSGGTASFTFVPSTFTALLMTDNGALTGNLTGKSVSDAVGVSGATYPFVTQNGGGCGNPPAVRFFFSASGAFAYTKYWWSNPESYVLANGSATLTTSLADPSQWSDWNGQAGNTKLNGYNWAVAHVQWIGLSYGGDCFFENGATVGGGSALFTSQFSEI